MPLLFAVFLNITYKCKSRKNSLHNGIYIHIIYKYIMHSLYSYNYYQHRLLTLHSTAV